MKNKLVINLIKYGATFLFGVALFFLVVSLRDIYSQTSTKEIIRFISDGFIVPGVILICFGALVGVANLGSFYGIGYALKHAVEMLIPFSKKKHQTYKDYVESKKPIVGYYFLYVVGTIFTLAGVIFVIIWYNM